jgi:hypothetical protein
MGKIQWSVASGQWSVLNSLTLGLVLTHTQFPKRQKVANCAGEETRARWSPTLGNPCIMQTQEVADSATHPHKKAARSPRSDIRRRPRWATRLFGPRSRTAGSGATGDRAAFTYLCVTTHS